MPASQQAAVLLQQLKKLIVPKRVLGFNSQSPLILLEKMDAWIFWSIVYHLFLVDCLHDILSSFFLPRCERVLSVKVLILCLIPGTRPSCLTIKGSLSRLVPGTAQTCLHKHFCSSWQNEIVTKTIFNSAPNLWLMFTGSNNLNRGPGCVTPRV